MSEKYEATKELTINGKVIKAGQLIPDNVDPERIRRGLHGSPPSVRVRRETPPPAAPPAAKAPAPAVEKAAEKPKTK
jgi:hypothetical protein